MKKTASERGATVEVRGGEHLGESCDSSLPLTKGTAAAILLQRFTPAPSNDVQHVKTELVEAGQGNRIRAALACLVVAPGSPRTTNPGSSLSACQAKPRCLQG